MTRAEPVGHVAALWRYPVKSMAGEELASCDVTARGVLGDRGYALVDESAGVVASAKNPRAWPNLLAYRASYTSPPVLGEKLPTVRITLPDGREVGSDDRADEVLSAAFGRRVVLSARPPEQPVLQQYWPDLDGTGAGETVTDEAMPPGTFFDLATVNLLLTTTPARLSDAHPDGLFRVERFRPNLVVRPLPGEGADPEPAWVGRTLAVGDAVRVRVVARCTRCVMTTLAQPGLPSDTGILRTVVRVNAGCAGLNGSVLRTGVIRVGDPLWFDDDSSH
jgi:uncharacterized protein YcbX